MKPLRTVPVRIDDATAASMKRVAALKGVSVGQVAQDAWTWWWNRHGDAVVNDLYAAVEGMRPR